MGAKLATKASDLGDVGEHVWERGLGDDQQVGVQRAQPLGAEPPVKAPDPVVPAAPVDVPAPPVAPPTPVQVDAPPPKDPAPVASERRASFTMPTGRIMIVCDRKSTIYVDNVKKGLTTDQRPIELTAGNHTVRLVAGGRSKTQQVRVDSEELRLIQFKF